MGRGAGDLDAQHKHPLRLHADVEVGGLARDRELAAIAPRDQMVGATLVLLLGLLVGDAQEVHPHAVLGGHVVQRAHHRRQAALHVVGAAPVEAIAVQARDEQLRARRNDVQVAVEDDRGHAGGANGRRQHGPAVVHRTHHLHVARLEPALDEPGGALHPLEGGRVVGDQALGESALVHPRLRITARGRRSSIWKAAPLAGRTGAAPAPNDLGSVARARLTDCRRVPGRRRPQHNHSVREAPPSRRRARHEHPIPPEGRRSEALTLPTGTQPVADRPGTHRASSPARPTPTLLLARGFDEQRDAAHLRQVFARHGPARCSRAERHSVVGTSTTSARSQILFRSSVARSSPTGRSTNSSWSK